MKFSKIYNYEERLVRFAGEAALFTETLKKTNKEIYYSKQLIRSSGSPALNFGEAQATVTDKDFIHKMSIGIKELKESRACLKILDYLKLGNENYRNLLLLECEELIAIGFSMLKIRRKRISQI
jgi:four helix bundle protein